MRRRKKQERKDCLLAFLLAVTMSVAMFLVNYLEVAL